MIVCCVGFPLFTWPWVEARGFCESVQRRRMSAIDSRHAAGIDLLVRDLGAMAYAESLALQRDLQRQVIEARTGSCAGGVGYLLLVEHVPPVITVTRRKGAQQHVVATEQQLRDAGVEVAQTDRGGDVTYHGPGQLVVYPILDLNVLGLRLHGYMRFLERIVIDTLAGFGVEAHRDSSATGVWVQRKPQNAETSTLQDTAEGVSPQGVPPRQGAKICAMGVRVSRWVSMHGLALNVTTNLDHFNLIVPCGLAGRRVTSLQHELGDRCPAMSLVKRVIVEQFSHGIAQLAASSSGRS